MNFKRRLATLLTGAVLLCGGSLFAADEPESWIDTPEAYFATSLERAEWKTLSNHAAREAFKERYWLRRDPTPGTVENEFRATIEERIRVADQKFPLDKTKGSYTEMGRVFIVLGTPARTSDDRTKPHDRPTNPSPASSLGTMSSNRAWGWEEGNEVATQWIWERDRTPRLLDTIGRPSLEITFLAEPSKRTVKIQNPGLFNQYRDKVAEASITNPDLKEASAAVRAAAFVPVATLTTSAPSAAFKALANSTATVEGAHWSHAMLFREGGAAPVLWVWLPASTAANKDLRLIGSVAGADGVTRHFDQSIGDTSAFMASTPGRIGAVRLPVSEGTWSVTAGVAQGDNVIAARQLSIKVPAAAQQWATSSLVLTGGPEPSATASGDFVLAGLKLNPRADNTFLNSESLWYFFEVANPTNPGNAFVELRLRREGQAYGKPAVFPASLQEIQPGVWLAGFEMPLAELPEGNYSIYVGLKEGAEAPQNAALMRADFRLIAR